jgi:phage terminase small subunit
VPHQPDPPPAPPDPDGLTPLERLFVLEHGVDENGTQAYLRSHPECTNVRTAATAAWRLLRKAEIASVIERERQRRYKALQMSADEALAVISRVARADLGECYDQKGKMLPFHLWPDSIRRAVKTLKEDKDGRLTVQLDDRLRAAELMAQAGGKLKNTLTLTFDHAAYLLQKPPENPDPEE